MEAETETQIDPTEDAFRQQMRAAREQAGVTQAELAELLSARGVKMDASAVARMERGERGVKLAEAHVIAEILELRTKPIDLKPSRIFSPEPERATHASLYAALAAAQAEFEVVKKGKTAKAGANYSFAYATMADYTDTIYPVLSAHGLSFTCIPQWVADKGFHLVGRLAHSSGEFLDGMLPLAGSKPQEIGGALSYARRQLFTTMTGATADDETSVEKKQAETAKRAENPNARKSTRAKAASAAAPVAEGAKPDPWAATLQQDAAGGERINAKQSAAMHALFKEIGVEDRDDRLEKTAAIVGRLVSSSGELSHGEAATLLDALTKRRDALRADGTIPTPEVGPCDVCNGVNGSHSRTCPAGSAGAH